MDKEKLMSWGLTEEQATKVMEGLNGAFVTKSRFNEVNTELTTAKNTIKERDTQLETLKKSTGDVKALQDQITQLQADNAKKDTDHAAELKALKIANAVDMALTNAKAKNTTAARALLAEFIGKADLAEDGTVKGLDDEIKKLVEEETALEPATTLMISYVSKQKGAEIVQADIEDLESRRELTKAIEEFGADVVKASSGKNDLLKTRIGDLSRAGGEGGTVAKGLEQLSEQMKDLDPSGIDFMKRGPLGKLFNPVRAYFNKYKAADTAIAEIIRSLEKGAKVLKDDNTTLELEQASMRDLTKQLNQKIVLGGELDAYLSEQIDRQKAANGDPEKIRFIEEEILFPLRQRMMDFNQMLAVNQNGIIAMEVIRKNNLELIRSVNRAQTVTIAALNVAVTVAGALYDQKIVLEKVKLLNQTTNNMIEATSRMLNTQGVEIQKQAMESNIQVDTLKNAFVETLGALEQISQYKQKALPQMKATIEEFKELAQAGEAAIKSIEDGKGVS